MTKKQKAAEATALLKERYPQGHCSLDYRKPHELLVSVRLAAQCTDARVNIVCEDLFRKYPDIESFANADLAELTEMVRPCGCANMKAKNIKDACRMLLDRFDGVIPNDMDALLSLPGVGRKSANLLLGDIYNAPGAVVADTHCIRITNRLGLTDSKDPAKVEAQLRPLLDPEESNDFCHRLVLFGREICQARSPRCGECPLMHLCVSTERTAGGKKK